MDKKLTPHFAWLYAALALGLGVAFTFLLKNHTWKVATIAIGLSYAVSGACASWLTRATKPQAVIPMVVAGLTIGAIYFVTIKSIFGEINQTAATMLAVYAAAKVLGVTLAAGIGGALGGFKLRDVKSPGDLLKRPA
jgi:hypothetical protein